jgi:hypothetical protein
MKRLAAFALAAAAIVGAPALSSGNPFKEGGFLSAVAAPMSDTRGLRDTQRPLKSAVMPAERIAGSWNLHERNATATAPVPRRPVPASRILVASH